MKNKTGLVKFLPRELQAVKWLSAIIAIRMLGLFMLLPILSLYAEEFTGSTSTLIGLAIGIYGLTQAILQIPFGMLSDKFGRKKVIIAGLLLFALGSVVAALASSIFMLILGRTLQGAGAVSAVAMALLADLTREEVRVRSMAIFGISVGFAFMLALVLGPMVSGFVGVSGVFFLTAALALIAILILLYKVPNPEASKFHADTSSRLGQFLLLLKEKELLRLDIGIFSLHMTLTAIFVVIPGMLRDIGGFAVETHGLVYLGVMLLSVLGMVPFVIMAEAKDKMKPVFVGAVAMLALAQVLFLSGANSAYGILFSLVVFFIAFNILESVLPSLVSRVAPVDKKGTAMGIYSSSQFLGAFTGGALAGLLVDFTGDFVMVFWLALAMLAIWFGAALTMQKPVSFSTLLLHIGQIDTTAVAKLKQNILAISGVKEVSIVPADEVAYVRIANKEIDRKRLLQYSVNQLEQED